jgi:ABC-type glycerol-3-phosphate transport system permease component
MDTHPRFVMLILLARLQGINNTLKKFLYAFVFLIDRIKFKIPIIKNPIYNNPSQRLHVSIAETTIVTIPVVILILSIEEFLDQGLVTGGVKG